MKLPINLLSLRVLQRAKSVLLHYILSCHVQATTKQCSMLAKRCEILLLIQGGRSLLRVVHLPSPWSPEHQSRQSQWINGPALLVGGQRLSSVFRTCRWGHLKIDIFAMDIWRKWKSFFFRGGLWLDSIFLILLSGILLYTFFLIPN